MQAIASRKNGGLMLNVNVKMMNSSLNGKTSSMVKTEIQEIEVQSTIAKETTVTLEISCFY